MTRPPTGIAASVKQKLLNLARERGEDFNTLLVRYGVERFLYRLSVSTHSGSMILKGAMLFVVWRPTPHRPTRDLDLLGFGDASPDAVAQSVREILEVRVQNDGLVFDSASVSARSIREDQAYEGVRVTFKAMLGKAVIDLQVDVGFGDTCSGSEERVKYPTLLDFPAPHLRAYTRETVVAEKVHAMVELGLANSRMKDFTTSSYCRESSSSMARYWSPPSGRHLNVEALRCLSNFRLRSPTTSEPTGISSCNGGPFCAACR